METRQKVEKPCIDKKAICAHSFQGKCMAEKFEHLCPDMKERLKGKLSESIGN